METENSDSTNENSLELSNVSVKSDNFDLNRSFTKNSSLSSPKNSNGDSIEKAPSTDEIKRTRLSKKRSLSTSDFEITKKSFENVIYEHAMFLLKNYKLKQLFKMFANLNDTSIFKWLSQYELSNL